jgi:hypothetical protein
VTVLSAREASIFACLVDTVVAPAPPLPPVSATDSVTAFDAWLAEAPPLNRFALRGLLYGLEAGPWLAGRHGRLRRLDPAARLAFLKWLECARLPGACHVVEALRGAAALSYYGDAEVMRVLGYDASARVARGRMLRAQGGSS